MCAWLLSRVRLCDPWTVAHQASLSMGFSRPEYWSGLPCLPPGDLPNPGIETRSPALRVDSLLSVPPGKPKNTGVGSLSLLQGLFPTQESNPGLPHCRQILYQLSYQYLPRKCLLEIFTKMSHKKKTEKPVRCVTRVSFLFTNQGEVMARISVSRACSEEVLA